MCCPCVHCNNNKDYSSSRTIHSHIFANGFMKKYVCWTKHGEQGVTMEDNEEEDFINWINKWKPILKEKLKETKTNITLGGTRENGPLLSRVVDPPETKGGVRAGNFSARQKNTFCPGWSHDSKEIKFKTSHFSSFFHTFRELLPRAKNGLLGGGRRGPVAFDGHF